MQVQGGFGPSSTVFPAYRELDGKCGHQDMHLCPSGMPALQREALWLHQASANAHGLLVGVGLSCLVVPLSQVGVGAAHRMGVMETPGAGRTQGRRQPLAVPTSPSCPRKLLTGCSAVFVTKEVSPWFSKPLLTPQVPGPGQPMRGHTQLEGRGQQWAGRPGWGSRSRGKGLVLWPSTLQPSCPAQPLGNPGGGEGSESPGESKLGCSTVRGGHRAITGTEDQGPVPSSVISLPPTSPTCSCRGGAEAQDPERKPRVAASGLRGHRPLPSLMEPGFFAMGLHIQSHSGWCVY